MNCLYGKNLYWFVANIAGIDRCEEDSSHARGLWAEKAHHGLLECAVAGLPSVILRPFKRMPSERASGWKSARLSGKGVCWCGLYPWFYRPPSLAVVCRAGCKSTQYTLAMEQQVERPAKSGWKQV